MGNMKLGDALVFDAAELATEVTAAIGIRGSGKSNALAVMAEGMLAQGIQVVVLDPVGLWFSLRLLADGKEPSPFKIHVLGGRHGDIPLLPTAGRLVASALATSRASAVLDVSQFSKADRCRFAADLGETLLREKKDHQGPTWLALDEAQQFVPQVIRHGLEYMGRMLGAFEEMAETGRNFGLGLGLASQRPQKVNKEVLNLAENVFAFRLTGKLERKAVHEWVQEKGAEGREEVDGMLPSLTKGEAMVWSPVRAIWWQGGLRKKATYDAGATPLAARASVKVGPLDLGALAAAMQSMVEEAARNDVGKLRARIVELERQLADRPASVRVEKQEVFPEYALDAVAESRKALERVIDALDAQVRDVRETYPVVGRAQERLVLERHRLQERPAAPTPQPPKTGVKARESASGAALRLPGAQAAVVLKDGSRSLTHPQALGLAGYDGPPAKERKLSPAALAMLQAAARTRLPGLTWRQMAVMAGRKASGGAFERDRRALLAEPPLLGQTTVGGELTPTVLGYVVSGVSESERSPTSPAELLAMWERFLPGAASKVLRVLVQQGPKSDGALRSLVGLDPDVRASGAWQRTMRMLRDNGLVERDGDCWAPIQELRP